MLQLINKIIKNNNQNSIYRANIYNNNQEARSKSERIKDKGNLSWEWRTIYFLDSLSRFDAPLGRGRSIGHVSSITQNRFNQRRIFHGRKAGEYSRKAGDGKLACCEVGADHDESMRSGICGRVNANMHPWPRSPRY